MKSYHAKTIQNIFPTHLVYVYHSDAQCYGSINCDFPSYRRDWESQTRDRIYAVFVCCARDYCAWKYRVSRKIICWIYIVRIKILAIGNCYWWGLFADFCHFNPEIATENFVFIFGWLNIVVWISWAFQFWTIIFVHERCPILRAEIAEERHRKINHPIVFFV